MVEQLNLPVRILAGETRREADGLAMSSRNQYLSPSDRVRAATLSAGAGAGEAGRRESVARTTRKSSRKPGIFLTAKGSVWSMLRCANAAIFCRRQGSSEAIVVLGAAWLGTTRLIDNVEACIAA